ncbi:lamin tail domain-containing protein, partial [Candidatus Roizmanbacteria bacterium]|nr:lamin tail domain-containing protein [Candidatus Roizmanbacteria bacterium]
VLFFGVFVFLSFFHTIPSLAAVANHVVISEVQVGGGTASDEFIELYNPTALTVDLTGWSIERKTASASAESAGEEVVTLTGSIMPFGYFLITSTAYDGSVTADETYATDGATIAPNNAILVKNATDQIVDKVGMGGAVDSETGSTHSPANNDSVERKAFVTSLLSTMIPGEVDEFRGNGEDTDNNVFDFFLRRDPEPQNTSSPTEDPGLTPTDDPTNTPTPTGEVTNTPTPTNTPTTTPTPTPTDEITNTPTPPASPTATLTPTETPTPTDEPTPTAEPTPETIRKLAGIFPFSRKVCYLEFKPFTISGFRFLGFPRFVCVTG